MALADDIRVLRGLNAAHDYYTDTQIAWSIVEEFIQTGNTITIENAVTGSKTTETDLAGKIQAYVAVQLGEATFQQFIAIFENFYFDLLRLWLTAYPQNLIGKKLDFKDVLEAPDKEALTALVVEKELSEILFKRPKEWFTYLNELVKLGCPSTDEIDRFAEAKASRDALVHNRGVASKTYASKAGTLARYHVGEPIRIPMQYHRDTWEMLRKLATDISNAAIAKAQ